MKKHFLIFVLAIISFSCSAFELLDATRTDSGLDFGTPITIVYENQVLNGFSNYGIAPVESEVKAKLAQYADQSRIMLDIESWTMTKSQLLDPYVEVHAAYYLQVLRWAKEELPNTDIGYFGMPAATWFPIKTSSLFMADYLKVLDLMKPVMELSDTIYPALYIYYDDQQWIDAMMYTNIYVAKAYGKPVYPVLWHRGPGSIIQNNILPDSIISSICSAVRRFADGAVFWSISWEYWVDTSWYVATEECRN